ncbi:MAG: hypothetical protein M0C28_11190 [Candidatus Moduliflexus flocculans]|nr:hypothetical protein [Candidatus Moduliflexus flocculans]
MPGASLLAEGVVTDAATAGNQWVEVDLAAVDLTVTGDFYVAMDWLTAPGPSRGGRAVPRRRPRHPRPPHVVVRRRNVDSRGEHRKPGERPRRDDPLYRRVPAPRPRAAPCSPSTTIRRVFRPSAPVKS